MFGRATITLGIGPHSSSNIIYHIVLQTRVIYTPSPVKHKYRRLALLFCL